MRPAGDEDDRRDRGDDRGRQPDQEALDDDRHEHLGTGRAAAPRERHRRRAAGARRGPRSGRASPTATSAGPSATTATTDSAAAQRARCALEDRQHARAQGRVRGRRDVRRRVLDLQLAEGGDHAVEVRVADPVRVEERAPRVAQHAVAGRGVLARAPRGCRPRGGMRRRAAGRPPTGARITGWISVGSSSQKSASGWRTS